NPDGTGEGKAAKPFTKVGTGGKAGKFNVEPGCRRVNKVSWRFGIGDQPAGVHHPNWAASQQANRRVDVHRDVDRSGEVVRGPERQNAKGRMSADQQVGDGPNRSIATSRHD